MEIRLLENDEEKFQARLISTISFHMRMDDPVLSREQCTAETYPHWGAFDANGKLMAHIINHSFYSYLDGKKISNGGIGGVSTLPEYRNTGAVRAIFQHLLPKAYAEGEIISTLYPFSHAFYRKFGYETVCPRSIYTFTPSVLRDYSFNGEAKLWDAESSVSEWTELYNHFAQSFNLSFIRDDNQMADHLKGVYYKDRKFAYMLYQDKKPIAYIIFQDVRHDPAAILQIEDVAWLKRAGFEAVLGFLSRFTADYGTIKLPLPATMELYSIIHSNQAYDIQKTTEQCYMIRVINAKELLRLVRIPENTHLVIRVIDDLIHENNNTWELTENGIKTTDISPDLIISVHTLGQLACGSVDFRDAEYRNDVIINSNRSSLEQVFIKKPVFIQDHF